MPQEEQSITLYPYPSREHHSGLDRIMSVQFDGPADPMWPKWRRYVRRISGGETQLQGNIVVASPDKRGNPYVLDCYLSMPNPTVGILVNRISETELRTRVDKFQERMRKIVLRRGWEIVDLATLQYQVDPAHKTLKRRGLDVTHFGEVEPMPDGGYGIWINTSLSPYTIPKECRGEERRAAAMHLALTRASCGWWTVDQIRQYADDPTNSEIFAKAMDALGFRRSKRSGPDQWVPKR